MNQNTNQPAIAPAFHGDQLTSFSLIRPEQSLIPGQAQRLVEMVQEQEAPQVQVGQLKLYRVDTDGPSHWFAARRRREAARLYGMDAGPFTLVAESEDVRIDFIDEPGRPSVLASEFMATMDGPGFVSSED